MKYIAVSLFDGMSCGQIALNRAGIKYKKYYASEIDKYAISITKKNYPNTVQLGDVAKLTKKHIKKIVKGKKVLLLGGSPCQGFSLAGKLNGSCTSCGIDVTSLDQYLKLKKEGFEFDGQSYLIWEYVRIRKIVEKYAKKSYFFLENVRVTKKWLPMFNDAIGVEPIMINSALVSAQNRERYYWTNIPNLCQPEDKGLGINDILEYGVGVGAAMRGRYIVDGKRQDHKMKTAGLTTQRLELRTDGKTNALTTVQKDTLVALKPKRIGSIKNGGQGEGPKISPDGIMYRKLTPLEYERLQTVPENYTEGVSNSQRYKMLGNGWTVDVIVHIFKGLKK